MIVIGSAIEKAINRLIQDSAGHPRIEVRWINQLDAVENPRGKIGFFRLAEIP